MRVLKRFLNVQWHGFVLIGGVPSQVKTDFLPLFHQKGRDSFEVFSTQRYFCAQTEHVWPGYCRNPSLCAPNPRHHRTVVEPDYKLEVQLNLSTSAHYETPKLRHFPPRRHEVGECYDSAVGFVFGLKNQCSFAVTALYGPDGFRRRNGPMAVFVTSQ